MIDFYLQLNYDLVDLYRTDDWKSTISHKSELVIAYDNKIENKTLHSRIFYTLYIRLNDIGNRHLVYQLFTNQILVTKEYQSKPVPEDLIEAISKTNSSINNRQAIVQNNHSNNHNRKYFFLCSHEFVGTLRRAR